MNWIFPYYLLYYKGVPYILSSALHSHVQGFFITAKEMKPMMNRRLSRPMWRRWILS